MLRQARVVPIRASSTVAATISEMVVPVLPSILSPTVFSMAPIGALLLAAAA